MVSFKCKSCGGQMTFGGAGSLVCPYCGSKSFFSDSDFKENKEFRKKMTQFYKANAEKKEFEQVSIGENKWHPICHVK